MLSRNRGATVIGLSLGMVVGTGCKTPHTSAPPPAPVAEPETPNEAVTPESEPEATAPQCEALPGWRYEQIQLPPEFAPELPAGTEVLWFSPGMFDPAAPDYFTYAFSLDLTAGVPDAAGLESLLTLYFRGLMTAVASGRDATPRQEAVVHMGDDGEAATIELSDEFTGGESITLYLQMSTQASCLRVLATARPNAGHWPTLSRSFDCLCDAAP